MFLIGFISISLLGFAQKQKILKYAKYDKRQLHFGFSIGVDQLNFSVKHKSNFFAGDSVMTVNAKPDYGFDINIISDLAIGEYLNLRFMPGIGLCNRGLVYTFYDYKKGINYEEPKAIESTMLNFPLLLKYKSKRLNNFRVYTLSGFQYSYDLASARNVKKGLITDNVRLKANSYLGVLGFGFDFYTEYFKFSPEFRYGFSANAIDIKDDTIYSKAINQLYSKFWMITLCFE